MTNQISFKANYIRPATILKRNTQNTFNPKKVSFVQLNPENFSDIEAVKAINNHWDRRRTLACNIVDDMDDCINFFEHAGKKFFAITTQKNKFEILQPDKVLGLAEIIDYPNSNNIILKNLQVHPQHQRKQETAQYRHIGAAILDTLKTMFPTNIVLQSAEEAENFYISQGFRTINSDLKMKFLR